MARNLGLAPDIRKLCKKTKLKDFILEVEKEEIHVHKAVMVSISEYFRAMLSGSMIESKMNRVKLKGQSVNAVSKLVELIYTADSDILEDSALEILAPAVYFQMPSVIEACVKMMLDNLNSKNFYVSTAFQKYSFNDELKKLNDWMMQRWIDETGHPEPEVYNVEQMQIVILNWRTNEWELFLFLKYWIERKYRSHKKHVNNLMSQVRFSLIDEEELASIKDMALFSKDKGAWCSLVREALKYHKKTIPQKVMCTSKLAVTRNLTTPVVFTTASICDDSSECFYILPSISCWSNWEKKEMSHAPSLSEVICTVEVNNFLIVCAESGTNQHWHIFNSRTKMWSEMAGLLSPKTEFALVHHDEKLYVFGGKKGSAKAISNEVEEYNFSTNSWSALNKMPAAMAKHRACAYDNMIYVSGGKRKVKQSIRVSAAMDCMDITSGTWKKKAPMVRAMSDHQLHAMTLLENKVIVAFDNPFHIECYQPTSDQWSTFRPDVDPGLGLHDKLFLKGETEIFVKGNIMFLVNLLKPREPFWDEDELVYIDEYDDFEASDESEYETNLDGSESEFDESDFDRESYESPGKSRKKKMVCMKWRFTEKGEGIVVDDFPKLDCDGESGTNLFGALLAVPT